MRSPAPKASLVLLVALAALLWAPATASEPVATTGPVVLRPLEDGRLLLGEDAFRGALEVRRSGSGLTVINELDLEEYLLGIREVPGSWPMEALKAQAVAARTYALWEAQRGRWASEGYDICPTVACQVFAGDHAEGEAGLRWAEAVRATEGQVLLDGAGPALTRYHASSGGATLPNHVVYPGSAPRPYLMGADDPDDAVSPLHTWTVDFPHEVLEAILKQGFGFEGPLLGVRTDQGARTAVVVTEGGDSILDIVRLRSVISDLAPGMFGDRYPSARNDGQRLPVTLPSSRFDIETHERAYRFHGRGHGHGVGMGQWGAMGRAARGESHAQILGHYYGGLQPQPWTGERSIRVAVRLDVSEVRVSGTRGLEASTPEGPVDAAPDGDWLIRAGPDGTVVVQGPPRPRVEAAEVDAPVALAVEGVSVPDRLELPDPAPPPPMRVGFSLSKPARVEVVLLRDEIPVAGSRSDFDAGPGAITVDLAHSRLQEGPHRVEIRAVSGEEEAVVGRPVAVVAAQKAGRDPTPMAIASLLAAAAAALASTPPRRRPASRPPGNHPARAAG